jgi:protein O-mannosyl-transferase
MSAPPNEPRTLPRWPVALLLFALTLALYWRSTGFAFLNYDDDVYVTANDGVRAGLSLDGLRWAFTTGHAANWHPLTWLSHQLDVELFGLEAGAHHRTNAVLHALNAALAFLALAALTGRRVESALAAAFFAWHPLRVESVAWVAERKDLLAASFALACLWAWAGYARRGGAGRHALALVLFTLGLLAKPMLVTLPCVLVLLEAWPLRRWPPRWRALAPFFALAAASAVVTLLVQRAGGALGPLAGLSLSARAANAVHAAGLYTLKSLVPTGLAAIHPHPGLLEPAPPAWNAAVLGAGLGLGALTALLVAARRRAPFALVGWLWFLGMLVPVLGLVSVGLAGWAERYTYLPSLGLALSLVWSAAELARSSGARRGLTALALVALAGLAFASTRRLEAWRDSRTIFESALAVEEANPVAHVNLARALEDAGDLAGADRHLARALELGPLLAGARVNRARVLERLGRLDDARHELELALASEPDLGAAHAALGWSLAVAGRDAEAVPHLARALELSAGAPRAERFARRNDLAWVLATSRTSADPTTALALAEELCRATKDSQAAFLETRAAALARLGRYDEAVRWQARALALVPPAHLARLEAARELYARGQPFLRTP